MQWTSPCAVALSRPWEAADAHILAGDHAAHGVALALTVAVLGAASTP